MWSRLAIAIALLSEMTLSTFRPPSANLTVETLADLGIFWGIWLKCTSQGKLCAKIYVEGAKHESVAGG